MPRVHKPFAIRQTISAGGNFGGVDPGTTPAMANHTYKYPAAAIGGLFNPYLLELVGQEKGPVDLVAIELALSDQNAWSLSKADADGNSVVLYSGNLETSFVVTVENKIMILEGQLLKLTSAGATAQMVATLSFDLHVEED